jgi:hypothetical protein
MGSAQAQPYGYGWGYRQPYGWGGGAVAAGVIGGAILGGLAVAASRPAYYGYGAYPAYGYGYGGSYGRPGYYAPRRAYYGPRYAYPAPYGVYGGALYPPDPYAAPHEIRDGVRTIYVPGRGRVPAGWRY